MLKEEARREFIEIITLDVLTEAALHTHCLDPVCVCVCTSETSLHSVCLCIQIDR